MSFCVRTLHNKFISLVNTRNKFTQLDRQLPKYLFPVFIQEVLGAQVTKCTTVKSFGKLKELPKLCSSSSHSLSSLYTSFNQIQILPSDNMINNIILNDKPTVTDVSKQTLCFTESVKAVHESNKEPTQRDSNRPSQEQLRIVLECLKRDLPRLFSRQMDYRIYDKDLIFVNNIKGRTTKGIAPYMQQIVWLRIIGHLKYAYVDLEILKITLHTEDDTIKVRWRIKGLSGTKILFKFWKLQESLQNKEIWHDGFSTFFVGEDGKIYKHILDKMIPNQDTELNAKEKTPIATKLALFSILENLETSGISL